MSPKQPLNRRFYEGPDVETLNILIELGEIVKHSPETEWQTIMGDTEAAEAALLQGAAASISSIRGIRVSRKAAQRLQEPAVDVAPPKRAKGSYDFRLPVFREGGE